MQIEELRSFYDKIASERRAWIAKNSYYHEDIQAFASFNVLPEDSVLEIGCGPGDLVAALPCRNKTGMDLSENMLKLAREKYPSCEFMQADAGDLPAGRTYDKVILSDTIGLLPDVQAAFESLQRVTSPTSRVLITYYNYLWEPFLKMAEQWGLKMPQPVQNWLPLDDIENLLTLAGFEVIRKGHRLLFPFKIPYVSTFFNRILARLPFINRLALVQWVIAKPMTHKIDASETTVSVMIPCRNELENIEPAILRTPMMGKDTELIFVDGSSTDGTVEKINEMIRKYPEKKIRLVHQGAARGKNDATRKGFDAANGDVLMILDADLTVPPEDLPKFFRALTEGRGEFINGTRLVYPMEKEAMRFLNLLGNKFFGMAFSYLLDQRFTDTLCGTKVLWRKSYEKIKAGRAYFGEFDPFGDFDLLFGAAKQNLKIIELPIRYRERTYGVTKIRRFFHGWLLLKMCAVAMRKIKFV